MSSRAPRYPRAPASRRRLLPGMRPAQGKLEALFITGHSLGAAMAAHIAARLFTDSKYGEIRQRPRGVYTFGQPMIGDAGFAARAEELFGDRLFRFVYSNDIVTLELGGRPGTQSGHGPSSPCVLNGAGRDVKPALPFSRLSRRRASSAASLSDEGARRGLRRRGQPEEPCEEPRS
ncbi:lipase family protein [Sorangium sp. So ce381]|uniref:lipase family protein n=1 Tax=Sorangium sp. So ce381 TaxID=3133307 RepID=UPI003F5C25F0